MTQLKILIIIKSEAFVLEFQDTPVDLLNKLVMAIDKDAVKSFKFSILEKATKYRMVLVLSSLTSIWLFISYLVYYFEKAAKGSNLESYTDALWWGLVTFLTVGYGDRYPVSPEGRVISSLLMFSGVIAIGILTAKISSIFLQQVLLEGRGILDPHQLNKHFVICGWKEDMQDLLLHILEYNKGLSPSHLVVVANLARSKVDDIIANPRLKDVNFIIGDPFQESTLLRANPKNAQKVLLLSDKSPDPTGKAPNDAEADARTIMTAITLSAIARNALVTAELLDPKLDQYLKMAGVSEIIYSRQYSRLLLGNAAGGTGVSNVIYDLLDPKANAVIETPEIDEDEVGKVYTEFKASFESLNKDSIVIGILENTGNPHRIKEQALSSAQKTADVGVFIKNLQDVKCMRLNHPVFNPGDEYCIKPGSAAIVINRGA